MLIPPKYFGDYRQPYSSRLRYRKKKTTKRATIARVVRSVVDAELKVRDLSLALAVVNFPLGSLTNITDGISQGDANTQRSGNWVKPVSMYGTFHIQGNPELVLDQEQSSEYRLFVYCWKEDEGVNASAISKVVDDPTDPFQGYNILNKGQFQILYTKTGIISNKEENGGNLKIHKFSIKRSKLAKVFYQADNPKNNQIFIAMMSNQNADGPRMRFTTRIRYTDS